MTRALMGLIKDRHGTYCAQQKVSAPLQAPLRRSSEMANSDSPISRNRSGPKTSKPRRPSQALLAGFDRVIRDATAIAWQAAAPPKPRSLCKELSS